MLSKACRTADCCEVPAACTHDAMRWALCCPLGMQVAPAVWQIHTYNAALHMHANPGTPFCVINQPETTSEGCQAFRRPAQLLAQPFAAMLAAVEEANVEAALAASRRADRGAAAPTQEDMAPPGGILHSRCVAVLLAQA